MMKSFSLGLALSLLLGGCVVSPVPGLPGGDLPEAFAGPMQEDAPVWPALDWWNSFNDEELSEVIAQVQAGNLDLEINRRNLEAAQISLREAGFNLLPTPVVSIGRSAGYRDNLGGESGSAGQGGAVGFNDSDGGSTGPFDLNASFTYNDILSRPATFNRAEADYDSRVAQTADVVLNTLGTASSTYFQILLTRDRIEAAQQNLENAEAIGAIAQARVDAGVAVPIEALQQQIAIERERANLSSLLQNDLAARASLALLMGRTVQGFQVQGQTLQDIEVPAVRPGLPSELLRRRPDLVQAEANLRGASANLDVVRTDLFPQISLTGGVNSSSRDLAELLSAPDRLLSINANLLQVLLDNGQRFRNIEQARLSLANSLSSYRRTVLGAFNEVEVLLSNIQLLQQLGEVAARNLEAAEESFRIAQTRYGEGVADYQTVLISQNTLFTTRNAFLDNKLQQLNAVVGFYQALGGGWEYEPRD